MVRAVGGAGGLSKRRGFAISFAVYSPIMHRLGVAVNEAGSRRLACDVIFQLPISNFQGVQRTDSAFLGIGSCRLKVWRSMSGVNQKRYATAKPIWATNIMRYMCAHDT